MVLGRAKVRCSPSSPGLPAKQRAARGSGWFRASLDPTSAPCPPERGGTKGVPPIIDAQARLPAWRRTKGNARSIES